MNPLFFQSLSRALKEAALFETLERLHAMGFSEAGSQGP
jgi:hypothetical protein